MGKKWDINRRKSPAQLRQQALAQSMRALSGAIGTIQSANHELLKCIRNCELPSDDVRLDLMKMQHQSVQNVTRLIQHEYKEAKMNNEEIKNLNVAERTAKKKLPEIPF